MPRNYAKQAEWERANYDQVKIRVKKGERAAFNSHLKAKGQTAGEWFKEMLDKDAAAMTEREAADATDKQEAADAAAMAQQEAADAPETPTAPREPPSPESPENPENPENPDKAKPKKKRSPSPTPEQIDEWERQLADGKTIQQIAEETGMYDVTTIRKRTGMRARAKQTAST